MVMLIDGKTIELKAFNRAWNEYRIENDLEIHLEFDLDPGRQPKRAA